MTNVKKFSLLSLAIIILMLAGFLLLRHHANSNRKVASATGCLAHSYSLGSSGSCVSDIQTFVDFMETDGLNECPFSGGQILTVNGTFDASTAAQVKTVQNWENCYNKQEGVNQTVSANGVVGSATWSELCTYAYIYQKQAAESSSAYLKASLAAGKNAGC